MTEPSSRESFRFGQIRPLAILVEAVFNALIVYP